VSGAYGSVVSSIAPVKEIDRCSDHRACWDKSIFANKENIHQNLICGIGMGVMETPVRTPCDHLFCSHCINQWLAYNKTCPVCREPVDPDLMKRDRNVQGLINDMEVCCTERGGGCEWTGRLEDLQSAHLCVCVHRKVDCPVEGCDATVAWKELTKHRNECSYRTVVCEPCGTFTRWRDLEAHQLRCSQVQIRAQECTPCQIQ